MDKRKFIKTSDKTAADSLLAKGYQLIDHSGNMYTFLNNTNLEYDHSTEMIAYSNILTM